MFLLVTRFSSSVFHYWVGRFFTRFPFKVPFKVFFKQIPCSIELASKEEGNFNDVTFGAEAIKAEVI